MTKRRPPRKPGSSSHNLSADALAIIRDPRQPQRRRANLARWLLKHGRHRSEALKVLKAIANKPDQSMTVFAKDQALRVVLKNTPELPPSVLPDNWWGRALVDTPMEVARGTVLIPKAEWDLLSDAEKFPLTYADKDDDDR